MEKLIATCLLVVMMVGLSFGDNNFNNNNNILSENNSANNTENTEGVSNFVATPTESDMPSEAASLFLKYKVNGELDSFPLQKEAKNGTYNYEDNTQKVTLNVLDNMVTSFNINGVEMAKSDISKFEKLINKIITSDSKQNTEGVLATTMPADKDGFYLNSDKTKMSVNDNGLHMNAVDDNGKSFSLSVDENGFKMDGIDENGQPIKMNIDKNGVNMNSNQNATYIKNGIITTFDNNGDKWVIKPEKDGIKYIEHFNTKDKLIEKIKMQNGKVYINDKEATQEELRQRGWEINDNGIQRIGGFKNLQPADNYRGTDSDVKNLRNELKAKHKALNDKALALKRSKGIDVFSSINPILNDAGRDLSKDNISMDNLRNAERKLEWVEIFIENKEDNFNNNDDEKEDLQTQIDELKQDIKELRQEIKECSCTANFEFRKGLIERLDRLFPVAKAQNQQVFNAFELRFLEIKTEWERGECDDNK